MNGREVSFQQKVAVHNLISIRDYFTAKKQIGDRGSLCNDKAVTFI